MDPTTAAALLTPRAGPCCTRRPRSRRTAIYCCCSPPRSPCWSAAVSPCSSAAPPTPRGHDIGGAAASARRQAQGRARPRRRQTEGHRLLRHGCRGHACCVGVGRTGKSLDGVALLVRRSSWPRTIAAQAAQPRAKPKDEPDPDDGRQGVTVFFAVAHAASELGEQESPLMADGLAGQRRIRTLGDVRA